MTITVNFDRFGCLSVNGDDYTKYEFGTEVDELIKSDKYFSPDETELIGQEIFDNIFHGENRLQILKNALNSGEEVTIKILSKDKDAQNIPFELIYNKQDGGYLAKHAIQLIRDIPNSSKLKPQTKLDVINMLMIISLPLDVYKNSPLDPLVELEMIYEALENEIWENKINIDVVLRSSEDEIKKAIKDKEYGILYFSGHGAEGGFLVIENDKDGNKERLIGVDDLASIFAYKNSIKLFILNGCKTAKSSPQNKSAAYAIYKKLPNASVIANTYSIEDGIASSTMKIFFENFKKYFSPASAMLQARMGLEKDWFKPVIYTPDGAPIFSSVAGATQIAIKLNNIKREHTTSYVFRYTLTRGTANLLENRQKHLVLHGIGGSGKSTMAKYLARFFAGKFSHTLFFDVREFDSIEQIIDKMIGLAKRDGLVDKEKIDALNQKISGYSEEDMVYEKIKLFFENVKGRLFLVLDNLEGKAQDENGVLLKMWGYAISQLQNYDVFLLLTSRLKVYGDERTPYDNALMVEDYQKAEIGFLRNTLKNNRKEQEAAYFAENESLLLELFGLHPLALAKAMEYRLQSAEQLFVSTDFRDYFEFYRCYFDKYAEEAKKFFSIKNNSVSKKFVEGYISVDFIALLTTKLLLLRENNGRYTMPIVVYRYFKKDFICPAIRQELENRLEELGKNGLDVEMQIQQR